MIPCRAASTALIGQEWLTPFAVSSRRASPAPRKSSSAPEQTLGFATRPIRTGSTAMMPGPLDWPTDAAITACALELSPVASRVRKCARSAPVKRRHELLYPLVVPRLLECLTNTSCVRYLHDYATNEFAGDADHVAIFDCASKNF